MPISASDGMCLSAVTRRPLLVPAAAAGVRVLAAFSPHRLFLTTEGISHDVSSFSYALIGSGAYLLR
jgi:hypothetical protein